MRKHLTPATVLAALALLVSLTGTAAAAVIISSNHQVGKHVISGASGPKHDKKNIVPHSIGSSDLHPGSVTGSTVKNGSLTGTDLKAASLSGSSLANGSVGTGKLHLPMITRVLADTDTDDNLPHHTVASVDGVTVSALCALDSGPADTRLVLFVTGATGGQIRGTYTNGPLQSLSPVSVFPTGGAVSSTPKAIGVLGTESADQMLVGDYTYFDGHRTIFFDLTATVSFGSDCDIRGVALPAPN